MNQFLDKPDKPVDIILADANPIVLAAMSEILEKDQRFSLVATSATAEGFFATALRIPVQIGIIDWNLPSLGDAKLIEILRDNKKAPRVVVYAEDTADLPRLAMNAGAAAFAPRSSSPENLLDICIEVANGKMVFPFLDVRELQTDPIQQLSKKEHVILEALSKGLTNRALASELDISINTVKFHLSNLYDKLDVKNRAQAIAFFYSSRLTRDQESLDGIPR